MAQQGHIEKHFTATETVRDIVIGMSDGLTVPFALAAGVSGAVAVTQVVVTAGLAEIAAGSIAMGLGGFLAARTDYEHFSTEKHREWNETESDPKTEKQEVEEIFKSFGVPDEHLPTIIDSLSKDRDKWVDFMMRFELGLEKPDPTRAKKSALTIALSYIIGGLIPLSPYILLGDLHTALQISIIVTLIALFLFGYFKGRFTGLNPLKSGSQTLLIGGLAAAVAFGLAKMIG